MTRITVFSLAALLILSAPFASAQLYTEEPIPVPLGQPTGIDLSVSPSDSIYWLGLSDTSVTTYALDQVWTKNLLYLGARGSGVQPFRTYILDSSEQTSYMSYGGTTYLYSAFITHSHASDVAVIWSKQKYSFSDIVLPRFMQKPVLRCAVQRADSFQQIFYVESGDHPTAVFDDNRLLHLAYEAVTPFQSSVSYFHDTTYYFVTSRLRYKTVTLNGQADTVANIPGGFRPQIHLDRNGAVHLFYLQADSSNSASFRLMYARNLRSQGELITEVHPNLPAVTESGPGLNRYPPLYRSFIDDSGRAFVGWANGSQDTVQALYFARFNGDQWDVDSLTGVRGLNYDMWVRFFVNNPGTAHALWRTYTGYPGQFTMYYSTSSPAGNLFAQQKMYRRESGPPYLVVDSRGVANALFTDDQGIGYFRDLKTGTDSVLHVSPGSSISWGLQHSYWRPSLGSPVVIDHSDQVWVGCDNGAKLVMIDRTVTDVREPMAGEPMRFALEQNWPNPWNPTTSIGYTVGGIGDRGPGIRNVKLSIYNLLGQEVAVLVNEQQAPGRYTVRFDGSRLASGVYLYRLQAGGFVETKRMLLLK